MSAIKIKLSWPHFSNYGLVSLPLQQTGAEAKGYLFSQIPLLPFSNTSQLKLFLSWFLVTSTLVYLLVNSQSLSHLPYRQHSPTLSTSRTLHSLYILSALEQLLGFLFFQYSPPCWYDQVHDFKNHCGLMNLKFVSPVWILLLISTHVSSTDYDNLHLNVQEPFQTDHVQNWTPDTFPPMLFLFYTQPSYLSRSVEKPRSVILDSFFCHSHV